MAALLTPLIRSCRFISRGTLSTTVYYTGYLRSQLALKAKLSRCLSASPHHLSAAHQAILTTSTSHHPLVTTLLSRPFQSSLKLTHTVLHPAISSKLISKSFDLPRRKKDLQLHYPRLFESSPGGYHHLLPKFSSLTVSMSHHDNHHPVIDGNDGLYDQKVPSHPSPLVASSSSGSILDQITHDMVASRFTFPQPPGLA